MAQQLQFFGSWIRQDGASIASWSINTHQNCYHHKPAHLFWLDPMLEECTNFLNIKSPLGKEVSNEHQIIPSEFPKRFPLFQQTRMPLVGSVLSRWLQQCDAASNVCVPLWPCSLAHSCQRLLRAARNPPFWGIEYKARKTMGKSPTNGGFNRKKNMRKLYPCAPVIPSVFLQTPSFSQRNKYSLSLDRAGAETAYVWFANVSRVCFLSFSH